MFEIRTKAHKMELRTQINFKTQQSNTVRMQKSAISDDELRTKETIKKQTLEQGV